MRSNMRFWVARLWSILLTFQNFTAAFAVRRMRKWSALWDRTFKLAPTDYGVVRRRVSQPGEAARLGVFRV